MPPRRGQPAGEAQPAPAEPARPERIGPRPLRSRPPAHVFAGALFWSLGASPASASTGPLLEAGDLHVGWLWLGALISLAGIALAATVRESLERAVPESVLEGVQPEGRRNRLERRLAQGENLRLSALFAEVLGALLLTTCTLLATADEGRLTWDRSLLSVALLVPLWSAARELLPTTLAEARGDEWLRRHLSWFAIVVAPTWPLTRAASALRAVLRRGFGLSAEPERVRRIVEGLREAIEDSDLETDLDANEREIIENVVEFHDVDAAALMTPRTEVIGVPREATLREALAVAGEGNHSRLPVYEESIDRIVGTFSVRHALEHLARDKHADREDRNVFLEQPVFELTRPALFVPETKRVSELLQEFRERKLKIAVVLDEYGGTSGLITLSDLLEELIGELRDEHDEDEPAAIRKIQVQTYDVDAWVRVADINEELELELPEEDDYETIAGFVLAQLGHFPKPGERLAHGAVELEIRAATDRRVTEVRLHLGTRAVSA